MECLYVCFQDAGLLLQRCLPLPSLYLLVTLHPSGYGGVEVSYGLLFESR